MRFLNQTGFFLGLILAASSASAALTAQQIQTLTSPGSYQSFSGSKAPTNASVIIPSLDVPTSGTCEQEACTIMTCDFQSDKDAVKKACGNNSSGGDCVREVCNQKGCNTQSDLLQAIDSCKTKDKGSGKGARNSYLPVHAASGDCVSAVCSHIGCAFGSETESIARACQHASGSCVRETCDQTGCTFKSDALSAIKSCDHDHID